MSLRIVHAADFHLDSPFEALSEEKAAIRRREQRDLLDRLAELADRERAQLVLLSGDLLDSATSFYETQEVLHRSFLKIGAKIFISPGNHDYYCPKSPYAYVRWPDNVHIFTSPAIDCVSLPELGCRVWGAAFNDRYSPGLLTGFKAPDDGLLDIMVLHGDTGGDLYNPVRESEIAASNLNYLALGHQHAFSGIRLAGATRYAYPGCPEGRGFDETGDKGVLAGSIGHGRCDLRFIPLGSRAYKTFPVDLTGADDPAAAVQAALPADTQRDIYKLVLTGEYGDALDLPRLAQKLSERFFHLTVRDTTRPPRDIWAARGDDTLRGIFIRRMKDTYDAADEHEKAGIVRAVRFGLSALENREEYGL